MKTTVIVRGALQGLLFTRHGRSGLKCKRSPLSQRPWRPVLAIPCGGPCALDPLAGFEGAVSELRASPIERNSRPKLALKPGQIADFPAVSVGSFVLDP